MYRYPLVSTVAFALACNSSDPGYVPPVISRTVAVSQLASGNHLGVQVAITVDDLPWSEPSANAETRSTANTRLIHTLRQRRAPASLFVNCARAGNDIPLLKEWLAQGFELGNHTAQHLSIDQAGAAAWLKDVRACDTSLRALTGKSPRFFRYPMLRQGATRARRDSAGDGIARLGYLNAHVTIDNSEYLIAHAYQRAALASDAGAKAAMADLYVTHLRSAFRHARDVSKRKLRREVAHVLLQHINQLNVDHLGTLLDSLAADGAVFVPLNTALLDPVYSMPDLYIGSQGWSWLYRIAPLDPKDAEWDNAEARRVEAALSAMVLRQR